MMRKLTLVVQTRSTLLFLAREHLSTHHVPQKMEQIYILGSEQHFFYAQEYGCHSST